MTNVENLIRSPFQYVALSLILRLHSKTTWLKKFLSDSNRLRKMLVFLLFQIISGALVLHRAGPWNHNEPIDIYESTSLSSKAIVAGTGNFLFSKYFFSQFFLCSVFFCFSNFLMFAFPSFAVLFFSCFFFFVSECLLCVSKKCYFSSYFNFVRTKTYSIRVDIYKVFEQVWYIWFALSFFLLFFFWSKKF